jgi:hypothetical protein
LEHLPEYSRLRDAISRHCSKLVDPFHRNSRYFFRIFG